MGKRKVFPTVDLAVPKVEHTRNQADRVVIPLDVIPPAEKVVRFPAEGNASPRRFYDFSRWYGAGIDAITYACQRQIERFLATHDGDLSVATVVDLIKELRDAQVVSYSPLVQKNAYVEQQVYRRLERSWAHNAIQGVFRLHEPCITVDRLYRRGDPALPRSLHASQKLGHRLRISAGRCVHHEDIPPI